MSNFLKNNAGLLAIAGVGLAGIFALKGLFSSSTPDAHSINTNNALKTYTNDPNVKKALTTSVVNDADEIQSGIYGTAGFGTDEERIYRVMDKYKTPYEVRALFVAYGERYTAGTFFSFGFYKVNLVLALTHALNEKEWARISNKFKMAGLI